MTTPDEYEMMDLCWHACRDEEVLKVQKLMDDWREAQIEMVKLTPKCPWVTDEV